MITNFNQFKQQMNESLNPRQQELGMKVIECCRTALKCGLDRNQTLQIIEKVFTDPAKAPEEINVKFVKENLDKIKNVLSAYKDTDYGIEYTFHKKILDMKNPFELIVSIEKNKSLETIKLFESLKTQIKKEDFYTFAAYNENGPSYFYINNLNILNDHNKKTVLTALEKQGAINIATQLKWARTLI